MDDRKNGNLARAPEVEDMIKVCRALNEQGIKYLLVGGFAVILHGIARGTKDINFIVDTSVENIRKIKSALSFLPNKAIEELADTDVAEYGVVRIADEFVIDLMAKACGIDYEKAKDEIDIYEVDGLEIPVASRRLLIKLKDTVRPIDKADVEFLKASLAVDIKSR